MELSLLKAHIMSSILYVIELKINEGKEQELRALIDEMVADTGQDEGTIYYHWAIDNGTCRTVEHYDSNESTVRHLQMFGSKFAECYMVALWAVRQKWVS